MENFLNQRVIEDQVPLMIPELHIDNNVLLTENNQNAVIVRDVEVDGHTITTRSIMAVTLDDVNGNGLTSIYYSYFTRFAKDVDTDRFIYPIGTVIDLMSQYPTIEEGLVAVSKKGAFTMKKRPFKTPRPVYQIDFV